MLSWTAHTLFSFLVVMAQAQADSVSSFRSWLALLLLLAWLHCSWKFTKIQRARHLMVRT
jgi:hypothetical protein